MQYLSNESDRVWAKGILEELRDEKNIVASAESLADKEERKEKNALVEKFTQMKFDDPKVFQSKFEALAPEQKDQMAKLIISSYGYMQSGQVSAFHGFSIKYLMENPALDDTQELPSGDPFAQDKTISQVASEYAVTMVQQDVAQGARWVQSLPAGRSRLEAEWNLHHNWNKYDPVAAGKWLKSLPTEEREAVENLKWKDRE